MGADKSTPGTPYLEAQFWPDVNEIKSVFRVLSLNDLLWQVVANPFDNKFVHISSVCPVSVRLAGFAVNLASDGLIAYP
jgi:hypothetical protein